MIDAFIIGAQKAGSTYLHNLLASDPRIAQPPVKEPHYYSSFLWPGRTWESLFTVDQNTRVRLDSSTSYLHIPGTAQKIKADRGSSPLILMVVRDPLERAVSAYFHSVKHGRDVRSASDALCFREEVSCLADKERTGIRAALEEGRCVYRQELSGGGSDNVYSDPLFNFRYASNSLYDNLFEDYFASFDNAWVIEFADLIDDQELILEKIYVLLGMESDSSIARKKDKNTTDVRFSIATRAYFRNLRHSKGLANAFSTSCRNLPSLWRLNYSPKSIIELGQDAAWVRSARERYRNLLSSDYRL